MRLLQLITSALLAVSGPFALAQSANGTDLNYEYIVVGSGAGGGPLACRLAMAGHKTLLIEAGNDQAGNVNISVPGYQAVVTQDPKLRWDIFVNHYQDQQRARRDPKYVWETAPFDFHVGPDAPEGATPRGILYPRAATLGGSVTHNALIWILPHASDWDNIAILTGDNSWAATSMQKYLAKVQEWQPTQPTDPTILLGDLQLAQHLVSGAAQAGLGITPLNALTGLANALLNDPNNQLNSARDRTEGFFQIPLIMKDGVRTSVREHIRSTVQAGHPLDVRTNRHVTKITFDESGSTPRATGVEFLDGEYLYRASPLSTSSGLGTPGSATASKEVIISGGTFNTPQLLKLSGIGAKDELDKFNISVISDLPGVGTNMQDRYEVPVNVKHPNDFPILDGCTFDSKPNDESTMAKRSDYASTTNIDLYIFGGPVNFIGYFPQWGDYAVQDHSYFSWYSLKAHTRNRAGTVELQSADPLDQPLINFNYFDTGTTAGGADQLDLKTLVQAINISRDALAEYHNYGLLGGTDFVEERPGPDVQSQAELEQYVKDVAWGHHASCSCPIGSDDDPNAVLDSEFRVRGVSGLRVVDASVFPAIPGIFITSAILMVSEKAADVILNSA
ncbi:alcohol oxidase [Byssothecium circinans]|uniref:Alcohol oxidase n=1 Tax=Byssothecium circinans TaxID=147558 RepID=A0A6A5U6C1_9PLEO|nr:alcohol oxidase [Byssothecium circinans]